MPWRAGKAEIHALVFPLGQMFMLFAYNHRGLDLLTLEVLSTPLVLLRYDPDYEYLSRPTPDSC